MVISVWVEHYRCVFALDTVFIAVCIIYHILQDNYDVQFVKSVYESMVVTYQELKANTIVTDGPVRIPYYTKDKYKRTAKMLGLMDDFRVNFDLLFMINNLYF